MKHKIIFPSGEKNYEETIEYKAKLWGSEKLITNTEKYCVKLMTQDPKTKVSLHYHLKKEETFILISGKLIIETVCGTDGSHEITWLKDLGDSVTLKPGTPHTFYTPDDQLGQTMFIEASTQDFNDDSYRIYPSKGKDTNSGGSNS